jgi:hypothetical protein
MRARLIQLLQEAKSFDDANAICSVMRSFLREFSTGQLQDVLAVGLSNEQVLYAFDYKNLSAEITEQIDTPA